MYALSCFEWDLTGSIDVHGMNSTMNGENSGNTAFSSELMCNSYFPPSVTPFAFTLN